MVDVDRHDRKRKYHKFQRSQDGSNERTGVDATRVDRKQVLSGSGDTDSDGDRSHKTSSSGREEKRSRREKNAKENHPSSSNNNRKDDKNSKQQRIKIDDKIESRRDSKKDVNNRKLQLSRSRDRSDDGSSHRRKANKRKEEPRPRSNDWADKNSRQRMRDEYLGRDFEGRSSERDIGEEILEDLTKLKSVAVWVDGNPGDRWRDRQREEREEEDRRRREGEEKTQEALDKETAEYLASKRKNKPSVDEALTTKTGGAYIPPARLRAMQAQITDKTSSQFQRIAWEMLKKSINGLINKVNVSNLVLIVRELFQENIVRGRGVLARSIMQAQAASPTFTHVYAALVSVINTKFPQTGELIVKRLALNFKKGFKRNDKALCLSAVRFIAHLVNQQVAHEILALEILTLLLESPTDDSVEVAIGFLKECGQKLTEVSPRGINAIFERLRIILHEAQIDKRVQYMIEVMYAVRKDGFKDHPALLPELDVVPEEDQCTHTLTLEDAVNPEDGLNVFKLDPKYQENEDAYKAIKRGILDEDSSDEDGDEGEEGSGPSDSDEDEEGAAEEAEAKKMLIVDQTETNLLTLRRTIYLTIQSSLDFEECAHKLLKMNMKPGQESELCNMILDCCAQQRTYEKFFGLLAQRFCMIDRKYIGPYQTIFKEQYDTIHRLETNKLRNVAKFFGHLLHTDAISWEVLQTIQLNEEDTTSSSRIFIKILFQELSEYMGLHKLNSRLTDITLQPFFEGLFPRDKPKNTRFAINFFTSIGLGGLTDELRQHLKTAPRVEEVVPAEQEDDSSSSDDSSDDTSSEDDDDDDSDTSSEGEGSSKSDSPPAPTRDQAKKSRSSAKVSDGPSSAQMKLLALAYGDDVTPVVTDTQKNRHTIKDRHRDKEDRDREEEDKHRDKEDKHRDRKDKHRDKEDKHRDKEDKHRDKEEKYRHREEPHRIKDKGEDRHCRDRKEDRLMDAEDMHRGKRGDRERDEKGRDERSWIGEREDRKNKKTSRGDEEEEEAGQSSRHKTKKSHKRDR